jgi:rod shape-determining protein MreD
MTGARFIDRRRRVRGAGDRGDGVRVAAVLVILLLLEFYLRPSLTAWRGMPDFMMLALLLLAIRQSPGTAAITGFIIGLLMDVLTPARFGAGILAHVLVGWGAAWGRGIFFADNLIVNAALFFVGTWVRDVLIELLSGTSLARLGIEAIWWAPLQGATTAAVGVVIVMLFREWLAIRIER